MSEAQQHYEAALQAYPAAADTSSISGSRSYTVVVPVVTRPPLRSSTFAALNC
jgi:hypothetical protein